jgi:hypothetical protein
MSTPGVDNGDAAFKRAATRMTKMRERERIKGDGSLFCELGICLIVFSAFPLI